MNRATELGVKALGAFYTPETIAEILADWVIQSGAEAILEPSAGDGALIRAALASSMRKFGSSDRVKIVACDVNPEATRELKTWLPSGNEVVTADFLSIDPASMDRLGAVLANPPFIRNHSLDPQRRSELRKRFEIDGAAGLWVHFLLHACSFLKIGGRLAAIAPASATFTRYGQIAIERICRKFSHVEIRQIIDRPVWVNGADERGVIILASGYGEGSCSDASVSKWLSLEKRSPSAFFSGSSYLDILSQSEPLANFAKLSIGAVTGCNRVFLLNEQERLADHINQEDVCIAVSRARQVPGLTVTRADLRALAESGEKTLLLAPADVSRARPGVRSRLALVSAPQRRRTIWLKKRTPWWKVDAGEDCDAIFTYMNDRGPRIVLAEPGIKCTNTLHRARFRETTSSAQRIACVLSMISTFGQLAAERGGRSYGGGILKFELGNARELPILLASGELRSDDLKAADLAIRNGRFDLACEIADKVFLPRIVGRFWQSAVNEMRTELQRLRFERTGRMPQSDIR